MERFKKINCDGYEVYTFPKDTAYYVTQSLLPKLVKEQKKMYVITQCTLPFLYFKEMLKEAAFISVHLKKTCCPKTVKKIVDEIKMRIALEEECVLLVEM